jgi:SAM-dependent methyltransferase
VVQYFLFTSCSPPLAGQAAGHTKALGMLHDLLRRLKLDRWMFTLAYRRGRTPWDTGIAPPELVEAVEGPQRLALGRALDLGCGTGTTALYLAHHGWHVTGLDFAAPAVRRAQAKVRAVGPLSGAAGFLAADAAKLAGRDLGEPFMLLFDQGCLHGIPRERWPGYAAGVARHAAPGATFLLYAFGPRMLGPRRVGITPEEVRALFAPAFSVERVVAGTDTGRGFASAWYWLCRA